MRTSTFADKTLVVIVMIVSAIITSILMGALWWSCNFGSIPKCVLGVNF